MLVPKTAFMSSLIALALVVRVCTLAVVIWCGASSSALTQEIRQGEMAGYLIIPNERVPTEFDAGFSMYVAAWPLLQQYPGQRFQSGLPGTWMFAQPRDGQKVKDLYSDIEGGLGWWRDTRFATETPKFIMGGVAPNFREWANGPGAGMNRDWSQSFGKYGVVQLSSRLLWPPDGLNLAQGMRGEFLGYGYLPLPLTDRKATTSGQRLETGNQCWTLFLNSDNFKGPVAFFTPHFWARAAIDESRFVGQLLDQRPSDPNRALQMETQHIPSVQATDSAGVSYARIAPVQFPASAEGRSDLVHQVMSYNRDALWNGVDAWFQGGPAVSGGIDREQAVVHTFREGGYATWQIYPDGTKSREDRLNVAWDQFAKAEFSATDTYGYRWDANWVKPLESDTAGSLVVLPEYYRLEVRESKKSVWIPVAVDDVPIETGLRQFQFKKPNREGREAYETPAEPDSSWKNPGPKAGPFVVQLGDGSQLTYYWYRFADQPSMLNADLTPAEREVVQRRVEMLHRQWLPTQDYLAPPRQGKLAQLDPALIVTPPAGLEVGYVPIVTKQESRATAR
jgi:hypothetical protein